MSDIELYEKSADKYEALQEKREDYVLARKAFLDLVVSHLQNKKEVTIADFCCGTGNNTHLISQKFLIKKATLVDINREFLEIAVASGIHAKEIVPVQSDILKVELPSDHDLVISMFAYHHVPDDQKEKYIEIAKGALKMGGLLLLGEIYSPDKQTTVKYYEHLLNSIPQRQRTPELEKFLRQTATSDHFEYKVSKGFAVTQLKNAGFTLLESVKIWPKDNAFANDVGTFVEVWKLEKI